MPIAWKNGCEFWKNLLQTKLSSNCGAGYSGVELACKLADRLGERGRFRLIELTDQILRTPEFNLTAAKPWKRGVFGLI